MMHDMDDAHTRENTPHDPWGLDRSPAEDVTALARQAVQNGGRIRQLEVALAAERRARQRAEARIQGSSGESGELAIRKFLDDVAGVGLPSTLYRTFSPDFRAFLLKQLVFWASTANRMLGEFDALPADAIDARDARYAKEDAEAAESGALLIKQAQPDGDAPADDKHDDGDAFEEWMRSVSGYEEEEDDE